MRSAHTVDARLGVDAGCTCRTATVVEESSGIGGEAVGPAVLASPLRETTAAVGVVAAGAAVVVATVVVRCQAVSKVAWPIMTGLRIVTMLIVMVLLLLLVLLLSVPSKPEPRSKLTTPISTRGHTSVGVMLLSVTVLLLLLLLLQVVVALLSVWTSLV